MGLHLQPPHPHHCNLLYVSKRTFWVQPRSTSYHPFFPLLLQKVTGKLWLPGQSIFKMELRSLEIGSFSQLCCQPQGSAGRIFPSGQSMPLLTELQLPADFFLAMFILWWLQGEMMPGHIKLTSNLSSLEIPVYKTPGTLRKSSEVMKQAIKNFCSRLSLYSFGSTFY